MSRLYNTLALLVALAFTGNPARAKPDLESTSFWVGACSSSLPNDRAPCLGFLVGLDLMHALIQARTGNSLWCVPAKLTVEQVRLMFIKTAKDNPEHLHRPASVVVEFALSESFPCKDEPVTGSVR